MPFFFITFAADIKNHHKTSIMEAVLQSDIFTVSVPKTDTGRFKGIVKAMGWVISPVHKEVEQDITKTTGFRQAMDDVKNGRVTHYASAEEMFKKLGIAL